MDKTNKVLQKDHPEMESALDSRRWDYVARALPFLVCLACFTDWSSLVVKIYNSYNEMLANGDHRLADWPLMSSPIPTFILTGAYLYFVKIAGPRWMENREPFDLRKFMIVYNFTLVTLSFWLFVEMGKLIEWGRYSFQCQVVDYSDNPIAMRMVLIGWYFYLTKFVEFIDTIIFVLRKKNSQISTLHVFHHSVVPITLWVGIKFASGGNNAWFPFLNSGVHTIMYMYYGLAAFGPKMQKYLWWKKYLTKLQLTQFTLALAHGLRALFQDCDFPRSFIFLNLFHAILFFYLFYSFYQKSYKDKSERSTSGQRVGLSVSASSGPAGASTRTFARFGDVTITASVHYHNGTQESSECHFKSSNISSSPPVDKEALVN